MTDTELMVIKKPLINFQDFEIYGILSTLSLFQIPESANKGIKIKERKTTTTTTTKQGKRENPN